MILLNTSTNTHVFSKDSTFDSLVFNGQATGTGRIIIKNKLSHKISTQDVQILNLGDARFFIVEFIISNFEYGMSSYEFQIQNIITKEWIDYEVGILSYDEDTTGDVLSVSTDHDVYVYE